MAGPTSVADGTQTAVITTEHTLQDIVDTQYFYCKIDLTNMAAGDITEVRIYDMVKSGGTLHVFWKEIYYDAQSADEAIIDLGPFWINNEIKFTVKQTAGTGRDYDWAVLKA